MEYKPKEAGRRREVNRRLDGFVEIDHAYLSGEGQGGTCGRGSGNKHPICNRSLDGRGGSARSALIEPVSGFMTAVMTDWTQDAPPMRAP